jgi:hypothetical protein
MLARCARIQGLQVVRGPGAAKTETVAPLEADALAWTTASSGLAMDNGIAQFGNRL